MPDRCVPVPTSTQWVCNICLCTPSCAASCGYPHTIDDALVVRVTHEKCERCGEKPGTILVRPGRVMCAHGIGLGACSRCRFNEPIVRTVRVEGLRSPLEVLADPPKFEPHVVAEGDAAVAIPKPVDEKYAVFIGRGGGGPMQHVGVFKRSELDGKRITAGPTEPAAKVNRCPDCGIPWGVSDDDHTRPACMRRLKAQLAAVTAQRDAMWRLLAENEWADDGCLCFACGTLRSEGHADDCEWNRIAKEQARIEDAHG